MNLPEDKFGLFLEHNPHHVYHDTIEEYVENIQLQEIWDLISLEEKASMLARDELWVLQWYPETTVGYNIVIGSTLERVIEAAHDNP